MAVDVNTGHLRPFYGYYRDAFGALLRPRDHFFIITLLDAATSDDDLHASRRWATSQKGSPSSQSTATFGKEGI